MVVFTCNNCGDSLQKPKVAKHYQFQCRKAISLTCVDCFKDFLGNEYEVHTKCITEAERYGGKDFKAKSSMNKGERKQQEWINIVKNVLESGTNLTRDERQLLQTLSKHENIPRKRAKFLNFVKNVMGFRVNMNVVESCWTKMEAAFKGANENKPEVQNGKTQERVNGESEENSLVENENNENICKENGNSEKKESEVVQNGKSKKKGKKRELEDAEEKSEEPAAKRKNGKNSVDEQDETSEAVKFNWKTTILDVFDTKEEMSLKKLKKKVVAKYLAHVGENVAQEKAVSRFDKKFSKVSELVLVEDRVKRA